MCAVNFDNISQSKTTQILILLNIVSFIILNLIFGNPDNGWIIRLFAQEKNAILNWQLWRLVTSIFVHWDLSHLINNLIGLLLYGALLETRLGKLHFISVYLISGIIGSIFSFLLTPPDIHSAGASGAIFGLMGLSFIVLSKDSGRIYVYGLIYIVYSVVMSFQPNIGVWAHIFGLVSGLIYGFFYYLKINKQNRYDYYN